MREFPPVEENVERPESLRQTLLADFDKCPRSGYLSLKYGGGIPTHAQARGSAFHLLAEIATKELVQNGEVQYPPELARDLMDQILRGEIKPEDGEALVVPASEHDSLRAMAWNWAKATQLYLPAIRGVERQAYLEVEGWRVHGTLDVALIDGQAGMVHDYKTRFTIPNQEEFERQFQGQFYGLLLAEGRWTDTDERVAPEGLDEVQVVQRYPRHYYEDTGTLAERSTVYDQADLLDCKVAVQAILKRVEDGLETGVYPAIPGFHCGFCAAPHECPIPEQFRTIDTINSLEEAEAAGQRWDKLVAEANRLKGSIRAWADANEAERIAIGEDLELAFIVTRSEPVKNKEALKKALATNVGNPADFFSQRTSTKFDKRRVK